jgi:hypothetical protein
MMARPVNKNLNNTLPNNKKGHTWGKKLRHDYWSIFHYRGEIKVIGKESDTQECKGCHKIFTLTAFTTGGLRGDGAYYLQQVCRECAITIRRERRIVIKSAPPKPEQCNCCNKKTKKLVSDHIKGSTTFRGWICAECNTGMGKLGDTLEGILQAAIYLENDKNKIITTLNKVFNEMFARTK